MRRIAFLAVAAAVLKALLAGPASLDAPAPAGAGRRPQATPAQPPPTGLATLAVASEPSGAEVRLNGRPAGRTPFTAALAPGAYQIELSLPGYLPKTFAPTLRSGAAGQSYRFELAPAPQEPNVAAFRDGLDDRRSLEAWFDTLGGDYRQGALYWASQRSLPHPGPCAGRGDDAQAWAAGCEAARQRLGPTDLRRRSEPDYKAGWNSYDGPVAGRADVSR